MLHIKVLVFVTRLNRAGSGTWEYRKEFYPNADLVVLVVIGRVVVFGDAGEKP